ncbi:spore maturation protein A [Sporobacter termitidis DSM 10068]|uniref:Spore maturation protein A n=1 Tax=Sporobacter termitidis DSM 10068 TaxID=1123282 RepID=A0A1M5YVT7_9FIRM|nr:spore maturation protein A [Sporobacter termitidis]SHI15964.1 spore maturation protein A [Sporobacter termitidis DSM 10068]
MALAWIWTIMVAFSVVFGLLSGNIDAVGKAALDGAGAAVKLCIGICGVTCLWTGVMEVMRRSGLAGGLKTLFLPLLRRLFPDSSNNKDAMEAVSANVSANLLGLGNAATPLGIKAATEMARKAEGGVATDDLCMLVVINTASIQLIPATVAALRAAAGSAKPFDILPAVWVSSVCSVAAGIIAAKILKRFWGK